jgi:hypothetical protein
MLSAVRKGSDSQNTRPELLTILQEGLLAWFENRQPVFHFTAPMYLSLIRNQSKVGWDQVLYGRFVIDWRIIQDDHLFTIKNTKQQHTGRSWITKMTTIIWSEIFTLWDIRKTALHGVDQSAKELERIESAKRETTVMYSARNKILPRDQDIFYSNEEEHFRQEPTSRGLQQWLNTWKPVIIQSVKEAEKLGTRGMNNIRNFFSPSTHQPHPP